MDHDVTGTRLQRCWMDLDDKGRRTPVFSTNVFIISRARKGNRIRQENRISIIPILTGRNVMLSTLSTRVFSWKRIFLLTRWRQSEQSKERGSWKVKTQAERALFSAWRLLLWGEARKTKNVTGQGDWILFVYSRQRWNSRLNRPGQHCGPMERTPRVGEMYLSFIFGHALFPLPFTFILEFRMSTGQRWQPHIVRHVPNLSSFSHASSARRNSCWHFLKPHLAGIHHSQLSASSLTSSFSSHRAAASDCRIFAFEGSLGWTDSFWLSGNTK